MGHLWMAIGLFLVGAVVPACGKASVVKLVSDCESTDGWSSGAQVSADAHEGAWSVATNLASGKTNFFTLNYAATPDLSQTYALAFWWRVEGDGLSDFKIKVINYPLVDGMQAVYDIWKPTDGGVYPSAWQRATVLLSEYDAIWGERPNLTARQLNFRAVRWTMRSQMPGRFTTI